MTRRNDERVAYLAALDAVSLTVELGEPRIIRSVVEGRGCTAACPTTKEGRHRHWRRGDGRPMLADERPEVMCAIGRCATHRQRNEGIFDPRHAWVHPDRCGWCEYPLDELLIALDWSTWMSGLVSEVWVWPGGVTRTVKDNVYENPTYQAFASMTPFDQRRIVDRAVADSMTGRSDDR